MDQIESMLAGDKLSLTRLISAVERESPEVPEIMRRIQPSLGHARIVGITGPPGAGKSTLIDKLVEVVRRDQLKVAVVAIDPTSPLTGGALLGDRIRMQSHYLDDGVFIRSMAARGSSGGLADSARGAIKLLDAFGNDYIFVETVGVGQNESDIMAAADTVVLVLVPEAGDSIQILKAGIFEIANIFAINKADREGAETLAAGVKAMLHLRSGPGQREPPVMTTQASKNIGIEELYHAIIAYFESMERSGGIEARRRWQRRQELLRAIQVRVTRRLHQLAESDSELGKYVRKVEAGELDPESACRELLRNASVVEKWFRGIV